MTSGLGDENVIQGHIIIPFLVYIWVGNGGIRATTKKYTNRTFNRLENDLYQL